jgi:hypothetical protein
MIAMIKRRKGIEPVIGQVKMDDKTFKLLLCCLKNELFRA